MPGICSLDCVDRIFRLMSGREVARATCVQKHWHQAGCSEDLWKHLLEADWGLLPPVTIHGETLSSYRAACQLWERELGRYNGPDHLPKRTKRAAQLWRKLGTWEILFTPRHVAWDDIAGQDDAKRLLQELAVWPMRNPHLFQGAGAPPRCLLLFGPPGTGKTLLGRAIASNSRATFFSIRASSLTFKWMDESGKMVRALFAVAAALQPAVIFIAEIDSLFSAREHAIRRLKTELLMQMDGVNRSGANNRILLVGATTRPEELDEAARRKMPKQLYIARPCATARESLLQRRLGPSGGVRANLSDADMAKIVSKTAGYSGLDMRDLIQQAYQGPVRDAAELHGVADISMADLRPVVLRDFQVAAHA